MIFCNIWLTGYSGGGGYLDLSSDGNVPFCPKNGTHNSVNSGGF